PARRRMSRSCGDSISPADGTIPAYAPRSPSWMDAPEHARWTKVTEVRGSRFSMERAACASNEYAERSHCGACHTGGSRAGKGGDGTSGDPSPEPLESPSPTISQSWTTNVRLPVRVVEPSRSVTVTVYVPSRGYTAWKAHGTP